MAKVRLRSVYGFSITAHAALPTKMVKFLLLLSNLSHATTDYRTVHNRRTTGPSDCRHAIPERILTDSQCVKCRSRRLRSGLVGVRANYAHKRTLKAIF
jgi:hypothetical protein